MTKRQKEILKRIKQKEQDRKEFLEILEYLANNPDMKYKIEKAFMSLSEALFDYLRAVKTVLEDFFESLNSVAEKIAKKKEKTYRFEISGYCEIDIDATSMEEAEQKCEEAMREIFDKNLFTDYMFIEEVEE